MSITPSQTVGPYFRIGLIADHWAQCAAADTGRVVSIQGAVIDSEDRTVPDAMLEIWQAGRRHFNRIETDPATGEFRFQVAMPGSLAQPDGTVHAPHLSVGVFARGLLKRLYTRIYFADDPLNASDPILALVPPERISTLIAQPLDERRTEFKFDVRLSGRGETVFFEC
jgi:protocatechuate 3,4-dioxygenase, alpha subunit